MRIVKCECGNTFDAGAWYRPGHTYEEIVAAVHAEGWQVNLDGSVTCPECIIQTQEGRTAS